MNFNVSHTDTLRLFNAALPWFRTAVPNIGTIQLGGLVTRSPYKFRVGCLYNASLEAIQRQAANLDTECYRTASRMKATGITSYRPSLLGDERL